MKISEFLTSWEMQRRAGGRPDPDVRVIVGHASYDVEGAPFDGINVDLRLIPQSRDVWVCPRRWNRFTRLLARLDTDWHRMLHWLVWRCWPWAIRM